MGMDRAGVTFASLMTLGPDFATTTARLAGDLGYRSLLDGRDHRARGVHACWPRRAPRRRASTSAPACWRCSSARPLVVAMAGATLQALHPDRDILLGIGISSPVVTERWHGDAYGDRPLARVREYVDARAGRA